VRKQFFGSRDEISFHNEGLRRNYDSSLAFSRFEYCAAGVTARVFTQPGSKAAMQGAGVHV
jgi:hypothetical protein